VTVKIPEIGPFLVTKGMAFWDRGKEKDAYDIYYCCKYYPGGINKMADDIAQLTGNALAKEGLGKIKAKFEKVDFIGPVYVADFKEISDEEERERVIREAFELVNTLMGKLGIESFKEPV
jgi:hypothetical protein